MTSFGTRIKQILLNILLPLLFNLRILTILSYLINRLKPKYDSNGALTFPFVKKRKSKNLQILIYHRVNDNNDPFFPATPIELFQRQMEYLLRNFYILSLDDAVDMLRQKSLPDNALVITFDDGYKDVYVHAFPILKTLSIPATLFLTTGSIGSGKALWHDRVFSAFRNTAEKDLKAYPDETRHYRLHTLEYKLAAQTEILRYLRSLDNSKRELYIRRLTDMLKVDDTRELPDLMLDWQEVKKMSRHGITIGSHTITHPILSRIDLIEAQSEICESKKEIESKLGCPITTFAYPNGKSSDYNNDVISILKETGYSCAVTTLFGTNDETQDLYQLRRALPWEKHLPTFATKLTIYKFLS